MTLEFPHFLWRRWVLVVLFGILFLFSGLGWLPRNFLYGAASSPKLSTKYVEIKGDIFRMIIVSKETEARICC